MSTQFRHDDQVTVERPINFSHERNMACANCGHRWRVTPDWLVQWDRGEEQCPRCGVDCLHEQPPRVTIDSDDPALDDEAALGLAWYHTTTHPDWPARDFDPAANLTEQDKLDLDADVWNRWSARQRIKALHLGTYEAAIQNMLRRIQNQGDRGKQFYLYRVYLKNTAVLRQDWIVDPGDWLGDAYLDGVCPAGTDAARYLNYHEDPGSLSLALGVESIASTQRITVPVSVDDYPECREYLAEQIQAAAPAPLAPHEPKPGILGKISSPPSPESSREWELGRELGKYVPVIVREQFHSAISPLDGLRSTEWVNRAIGIFGLIVDPECTLQRLDAEPVVIRAE